MNKAFKIADPVLERFLTEAFRTIGHENLRVDAGVHVTQLKRSKVANFTVNTAETKVPHGLGVRPLDVIVLSRGAGYVYQSSEPDASYVYLRASAQVTCDITVLG